MAKRTHQAKKTTPTANTHGDFGIGFVNMCAAVITKVGLSGFVTILGAFIILTYPSPEQKKDIIDAWILFRCIDCATVYQMILIALAILFAIQRYFYRNAIKVKDERIEEITEMKKELQKQLINKQLKSTNYGD